MPGAEAYGIEHGRLFARRDGDERRIRQRELGAGLVEGGEVQLVGSGDARVGFALESD